MKTIVLLLLLCGFCLPLKAQFLRNEGAKIVVGMGTFARSGTWTNQTVGSETTLNAGQITLSQDLVNNGIFTGNTNSSVLFSGTAMQYVRGTIAPVLYNMQINNAANHVSLVNSVRIANNLLLNNGRLFSETAPVYFMPTALNPAETNVNRIIGTAVMEQRGIGTAAFPLFLNAQMSGVSNIGNVTLTRRTGTQGIITLGGFSGIASYWTFETSATAPRNLTLSWLSDLDNGKNLLQMQRWRTEVYNTVSQNWKAVADLTNLSTRTFTQLEADLQHSWTYSDNSSLLNTISTSNIPKVPLLTVKAGSERVTLSWAEDVNASGYEIYMYSANQIQRWVGGTSNTTYTVTGLENGTTYFFRIKAIGSQGGSDFSNTVSARPSIVLGTEEETASSLFKVYPNPSNGNFNLFISELKGKNAQINVLDMSGRVVFNQAISANGSLETELNLNLANGMYLLQVSTEKENLRKKIIMTK